ncbi:MAG: hypothetical protein Q8N33_07555, partial [Rhodocyclaceae bacterium]|nr:hypothetical protein [Rhodocyclaceae bacterium]
QETCVPPAPTFIHTGHDRHTRAGLTGSEAGLIGSGNSQSSLAAGPPHGETARGASRNPRQSLNGGSP